MAMMFRIIKHPIKATQYISCSFRHGTPNTTYTCIYYRRCKEYKYFIYQQLLTHLEKYNVIKVFASKKHPYHEGTGTSTGLKQWFSL